MTKPPVPKHYGVFKKLPDGNIKFRLNDPKGYQDYLNYNFKDGQQGYCTVKKENPRKRTTGLGKGTPDAESNQNGYLWNTVLPPLCDYFGYTKYEMLDALRPLFFFTVSDKDPNIKKLESTTEYDTAEWEKRMQEIRDWALAKYQIRIAEPNEVVDPDTDTLDDELQDSTPDPVNPLLELFKDVNPSYARLYANKTQRSAMERLIKTHTAKKLEAVIKFLPTSNTKKGAPIITTPMELETGLGKLFAWAQRQKESKRKVADLTKKKTP